MLNIDKPMPLVYHQGKEVFKESRANAISRQKFPRPTVQGCAKGCCKQIKRQALMELLNLSPFSDIYLHLTQCFTLLALLKDWSQPRRCVDRN